MRGRSDGEKKTSNPSKESAGGPRKKMAGRHGTGRKLERKKDLKHFRDILD